MRAFGHTPSRGPSWLVGVAIFVGVLVVVQLLRGGTPVERPLQRQFAAQPAAGESRGLELPPLPSNIAELARGAIGRINAGEIGAPLTPVAETTNLRVEIKGIREVEGGLRVTGSVVNIGSQPLPVTLAAFRFTDESGTVYAAESDATTTLAPTQQAPLDLTLPVQNVRDLTLTVEMAGEPPLQMLLLQSPP